MMTNGTGSVSRRSLGGLGVAALAMPVAISPAMASQMRPAGDLFGTGADMVRAVVKMRAGTDGRIRFGWLEAFRSAYIDGEIFPMMGMLAGALSRARDNGDGTFNITVLEITYYLDPETGEFRDTLTMPVTGMEVRVPLYRSGPAEVPVAISSKIDEVHDGSAGVVDDDEGGGSEAFAPKGDVKLDRSVGPAFIDGDDLWIKTAEYGRVSPANPSEQPVFYNESAIWIGNRDELLDPDVHTARTKLSYSAASSWRPWMKMGDVKGHSMAHGIGGKCGAIEEMPEQWLDLTEKYHPDVLRDPAGVMDG